MGDQKTITYEMLYDMLRAEKNSTKLQSISSKFYDECKSYFNGKMGMLRVKPDNKFAQKDFLLMEKQMENVRALLSDLYTVRVKKIVSLAQDKARVETIVIDHSSMLPNEKELFDNVLLSIQKHKDATLHAIFDGTEICGADDCKSIEGSLNIVTQSNEVSKEIVSSRLEKRNDIVEEDPSNIIQDGPVRRKEAEMTLSEEIADEIRRIEFLQPVAKFFDAELNSYGPFDAGNTIALPGKIIQILLDRGAVKILE